MALSEDGSGRTPIGDANYIRVKERGVDNYVGERVADGYGDGRREHVVGKLAGVVSAARSSMEFGAGGGVLSWGFKVEAGAGDCCAAMAIF